MTDFSDRRWFGEALKSMRLSSNLKLYDVASALGVTPPAMRVIERTGIVAEEHIPTLSRLYDVPESVFEFVRTIYRRRRGKERRDLIVLATKMGLNRPTSRQIRKLKEKDPCAFVPTKTLTKPSVTLLARAGVSITQVENI